MNYRYELIDVCHTIEDGMVTYKGLPPPVITDHLTREQSRRAYAPGTEFHIGKIEMVANTGTYLDSPFKEDQMGLSESLLPEFDQEMANTRKTLERVPDEKFDWKPHEKSWAMGGLATHLANLPSWGSMTIGSDSFDLAPGGKPQGAAPLHSQQQVLETFDKNVATTRAAIASASDQDLFRPWTLMSNGNTILTLPKIAVLRSFVMNHIIHHRAQLGVYLRLNDIPVPSIYGPSADEGAF